MLPAIRTDGDIFSIPRLELTESDMDLLSDMLEGFHGEFYECFARSESREHFMRYMIGQLGNLGRKSIEPIAINVEGGNIRAMQRFVSDTLWDEERMLGIYHGMVAEDMGDPNGVLIFDESGFVKKGKESAGVARQYCGSVGKVENSQVGVFAAYASPHGYCLSDSCLFVPEKWYSEEYADKREKCKFPEDIGFRTKPRIAVGMFREIRNQGIIPFRYVVADTIYGNSPEFVKAIDDCVGTTYFVSVSSATLVWLTQPATTTKTYEYGGQERTKTVIADTRNKPLPIKAIAESINDYFWYRRCVSEGTKGPIIYEFAKRRVVLSEDGLPGQEVWLIVRRSPDRKEYSFYISNAMGSTRLGTFVWLSGIRWAIEQCFEESKTELGMDHYEVRKFPGWHHHMLTVMLAHFFLWHLKIRLGKKSASHYSVAA